MTAGTDLATGFRLGQYTVLPARCIVRVGEESRHVEPKVMDVLLCFAANAGDVVTKQQLVDAAWGGRPVTDEVIMRSVSTLRGYFDDDARAPRFVETVHKRGYRLLVTPEPLHEARPEAARPPPAEPARRMRQPGPILLVIGLAVLASVAWWLARYSGGEPEADFESIAVLPFNNMSTADMQYLADGITEELTFALATLPDLKVAARTTAFQFRNTALDVREIGDLIDVDSVIEGSVRREGERLRVTAQLIDARSGYHLWAETFEGNVSDVFRLQRQVAERVRDSIRGDVRAPTGGTSEPTSFAAYDAYLRGRYALNLRGAASLNRAIGLFQDAIAEDPGFGPAFLDLAQALLLLPSYSDQPAEAMYREALNVIEQGVAADPSIAQPAAAIDGYIQNKRGNWLAADRAYQDALRAPQASSTTHQWYSNMLASVGRLDAALEQAQRARRLDPLSPVVLSRLAMTYLWNNDHVEAARHFAAANELGIRSALHTESELLLLIRDKRFAEAHDLTDERLPAWVHDLLECVESASNCEQAGRALADEQVPARVKLVGWALLQRPDQVGRVASLLVNDTTAYEPELLFIRELADWRQTPAFPELVAATGIGRYWRDTGCTWSADRLVCPAAR